MNEINFDELEHIRQSNNRTAQYQLKREGDNKFIISATGKSIIGHDATKGIDLRAGNGTVLVAVRDKDDKRCTRGLLNGAIGKTFTSSKLEESIQRNLAETTYYDFEFKQEYQDARYFALVPVDEEIDESASDDDDVAEEPQAEVAPEPQAEAPVAEERVVTQDDDF